MPFIPPSIPLTSMNPRQQAEYFAQQGIQATGGGGASGNGVRTFTPTWTGFSVDPTGDLSYFDLGATVMLWADSTFLGTSNSTAMTITNLPSSIQPTNSRNVMAHVLDSSNPYVGLVGLTTGSTVTFSMGVVSGTKLTFSTTGFTAAGNKGLAAGFLITYSK